MKTKLLTLLTTLILIMPLTTAITLEFGTLTITPTPSCGSNIVDFTFIPDHNTLVLLLDNNKANTFQLTGQTAQNTSCQTISGTQHIHYNNATDTLLTDTKFYTVTWAGIYPLLNDQGNLNWTNPIYTTQDDVKEYYDPIYHPTQPYASVTMLNRDFSNAAWSLEWARGNNQYNTLEDFYTNASTPFQTGSFLFGMHTINTAANKIYFLTTAGLWEMNVSAGYSNIDDPIQRTVNPTYPFLTYNWENIYRPTMKTVSPNTQNIYYLNANPLYQMNLTAIDPTTYPFQLRGTCPGTGKISDMYYQNDNEIYIFQENKTTLCDYTNPTTPASTDYTNIQKVAAAKRGTGAYSGYLLVGIDTGTYQTQHRTFQQVKLLTGFTNSTTFNYPTPPTIVVTNNTAVKAGSFTAQTSTHTYKDLALANSVAFITGTQTSNNNGTLTAVDVSYPPNLNLSPTYRNYPLSNALRTLAAGQGVTVSGSQAYALAQDTTTKITPATQAATGGVSQSTAHTFSQDADQIYYQFRDATSISNNIAVACLWNTKDDLYTNPKSEMYLYNHTNSTDTNVTVMDNTNTHAYTNYECQTLTASNDILFVDTQANGIYLANLTDYTTISSNAFTPTPTLTNARDTLAHDTTTRVLAQATGATGLRLLNTTNPASLTKIADCTPATTQLTTTSVTQTAPGVFQATGFTNAGASIIYTCNTTYSTTQPQNEYAINTPVPLSIEYATPYTYVMGYTQLDIYQLTTSYTNITNPNYTSTGTGEAHLTFKYNGQPVPAVSTNILNIYTGQTYQDVSAANGDVHRTGLPAGSYYLTYTHPTYNDATLYFTLTSNEALNTTIPLTIDTYTSTLPDVNTSLTYNRSTTCKDFIKNTWLCGMSNYTCTQDTDCPTGECVPYGASVHTCSSFNYKLCDAAGTERNQRCVISMTFKGAMNGVANHVLTNFLYYAILLTIIILIIVVLVSARRKR